MLSAQAEEVLEQLERAHNRLFLILLSGFMVGFFCGLVAAWVMVK